MARSTRRHPGKLSLNTEFRITTKNLEDIATEEAPSESWKTGPGNYISYRRQRGYEANVHVSQTIGLLL